MKYHKEYENKKRSPIRQSKAFRGKLVSNKGDIPENSLSGIALSVIGNTVLAEINSNMGIEYIDCSVSGRVVSPNKDSTLVSVGDFIKILPDDSNSAVKTGRVVAVEQRISKLSRKAAGRMHYEHVIAANFDYLIILVSTFQPSYHKRFIDRLILASEIGGVKPIIVVNKMDLAESLEFFEDDLYVYKHINVPVLFISAIEGTGTDDLLKLMTGHNSLLFGPSGVGKSTLVNRLLGDNIQQIREISDRTNKGQHTTSFVKMLKLPGGGNIIDSPGVREFAMWDIDKLNLAMHYHDFDEYFLNCKFLPCSHRHEPGCAVIEAIEKGLINPERYESYINIYESLDD